MNIWRKIESYIKPALLVGLVILLFLFGAWKEAKAEMTVGAGPGLLSGQYSKGGALVLQDCFDKYCVGLGYISEQEVTDRSRDFYEVRENLWVYGQRRVSVLDCGEWSCIDIGLGVAYFNGTNRALGSKFNASLSIEMYPQIHGKTANWGLTIRHYSNAGSSTPNMGQDMLLITYTFR